MTHSILDKNPGRNVTATPTTDPTNESPTKTGVVSVCTQLISSVRTDDTLTKRIQSTRQCKRHRTGNDKPQEVTPSPHELHLAIAQPGQDPPCCNCTKRGQYCLSKRCRCRREGLVCTRCPCKGKCTNRGKRHCGTTTPTNLMPTLGVAATRMPAPGNDEFRGKKNKKLESDRQADAESDTELTTEHEEERICIGDLPGTVLTDVDRMMDRVYGDHVHHNDGTHLDGGISDDATWQDYWKRLIVFPGQTYNLPKGKVGKRFLFTLASILEGVKIRKWNSEVFLVFCMVVLQRGDATIRTARAIRDRLTWRLDAWDRGAIDMLVQNTVLSMQTKLCKRQDGQSPERRARVFQSKMLKGDVRGAVKYLTETEKGGVMMPDEIDEKSGLTVKDVLESKHPAATTPQPSTLHPYDVTPEFSSVDITHDTIEQVARNLSGSSGLGGVDSQAVAHWLLAYGNASATLRHALASFTNWLANTLPPWAAYRALWAGRLLALDKMPGIRPIGIGETWRRAIAKAVLLVTAEEVTMSCKTDNLCGGLSGGIDGAIHAAQSMWDQHHMEEDWGFLLVDAANAFNELDRTNMLWEVRHGWPSGARFVFNSYKHFAILVIRNKNGTGEFILSRQGVTQGDPLAMDGYALGILPLTRRLQREFPHVDHSWYADDAAGGGTFHHLRDAFHRLKECGPQYGYHPEPTKSILIVSQRNLEKATAFFAGSGFRVCTGERYLGGFIGETQERDKWLKGKTDAWENSIQQLSDVAGAYPQSAYAGLQKSIQAEWTFVQRVVRGVGPKFDGVRDKMRSTFLPALLKTSITDGDPILNLACLPVKNAGLALPNPVESAEANFRASEVANSHIIQVMRKKEIFSLQDHSATTNQVKGELKKRRDLTNKAHLDSILGLMTKDLSRTVSRGCETGAWLTVMPSTIAGTELSADEYRDSLHMRYGREPAGLQPQCDGCGAKFDTRHAFSCRKGGLIIIRHNEIRDELCDMACRAFQPSAIRDEPKIHQGRGTEQGEKDKPMDDNDNKGDVLIRGLWEKGTDCIIDVRVTDTDAPSYIKTSPAKALETAERAKKKKHLQACLDQRRHFSPFVVSVDGLLGKEAKTILKVLASKMATKAGKPYSSVMGFVRARFSIAMVRATHICLRGSRTPTSRMSTRRPLWEDGAGIALLKY
jgi:hypothetical protein